MRIFANIIGGHRPPSRGSVRKGVPRCKYPPVRCRVQPSRRSWLSIPAAHPSRPCQSSVQIVRAGRSASHPHAGLDRIPAARAAPAPPARVPDLPGGNEIKPLWHGQIPGFLPRLQGSPPIRICAFSAQPVVRCSATSPLECLVLTTAPRPDLPPSQGRNQGRRNPVFRGKTAVFGAHLPERACG